ncbi:MAG: phosphate ABC transporter substrate-binding protein PstS [Paludibacter sp.]|jgi:phosphate transport system substrate-binding protein|nr:phosphate ABC transporter substrate-binding protein PstS [Paludibacter sp.]
MKKKSLFLSLVAILATISSSAFGQSLSGAGATFPLPFYNMAFQKYTESTGVKVTYGGIGSGGGIRSLSDKVVDFGASDAFLSDKELAEMPATIVHMPTCSGAVVVAFNLPGIQSINLTSDVLVNILLGKIKNWNDPSLKKLNASVKFPDMPITVVYRSDGSGTTNMFTDYLTKVSKEWANKLGSGKTVNWPVGVGAKGNPGVAGTISQTKGSIGYVGSEYSFAQKIPTAYLKNKAGKFIKPSMASISAAGQGTIPADTRVMLTNSDAPYAYPIAGFTWIIIYKEQNYNNRTLAQAEATLKLLSWMLTPDAQKIAPTVNYASLPEAVVKKANAILRTVTYNGKPVLK